MQDTRSRNTPINLELSSSDGVNNNLPNTTIINCITSNTEGQGGLITLPIPQKIGSTLLNIVPTGIYKGRQVFILGMGILSNKLQQYEITPSDELDNKDIIEFIVMIVTQYEIQDSATEPVMYPSILVRSINKTKEIIKDYPMPVGEYYPFFYYNAIPRPKLSFSCNPTSSISSNISNSLVFFIDDKNLLWFTIIEIIPNTLDDWAYTPMPSENTQVVNIKTNSTVLVNKGGVQTTMIGFDVALLKLRLNNEFLKPTDIVEESINDINQIELLGLNPQNKPNNVTLLAKYGKYYIYYSSDQQVFFFSNADITKKSYTTTIIDNTQWITDIFYWEIEPLIWVGDDLNVTIVDNKPKIRKGILYLVKAEGVVINMETWNDNSLYVFTTSGIIVYTLEEEELAPEEEGLRKKAIKFTKVPSRSLTDKAGSNDVLHSKGATCVVSQGIFFITKDLQLKLIKPNSNEVLYITTIPELRDNTLNRYYASSASGDKISFEPLLNINKIILNKAEYIVINNMIFNALGYDAPLRKMSYFIPSIPIIPIPYKTINNVEYYYNTYKTVTSSVDRYFALSDTIYTFSGGNNYYNNNNREDIIFKVFGIVFTPIGLPKSLVLNSISINAQLPYAKNDMQIFKEQFPDIKKVAVSLGWAVLTNNKNIDLNELITGNLPHGMFPMSNLVDINEGIWGNIKLNIQSAKCLYVNKQSIQVAIVGGTDYIYDNEIGVMLPKYVFNEGSFKIFYQSSNTE